MGIRFIENNEHELINILLVDDDEIDRRSIKMGFEEANFGNPIVEAKDGIDALDCLRGTGDRSQIEKPYIILLDLNMPRLNGIEFLEELRKNPGNKHTTVFVLTTSKREEDKKATEMFHVAGYMLKSTISNDFMDVAEMIRQYCRLVEM